MADVGKAIIGGVLTIGGLAITAFTPIKPLGWVIASIGMDFLTAGLIGLPQEEGIENTAAGPQSPLPVIYGRMKVGHAIIDVREDGTANKYMFIVGAIAVGSEGGGGIQSVDKVLFDNKLAIDAPSFTSTNPGTLVTNDDFKDDDNNYLIRYNLYSGQSSGSYDPWLFAQFPTEWPITSKPLGIAMSVIRLEWDKTKTQVFASGMPEVQYIVKGNKVYDPRTTNTVYSTNPALALRDYLTSTAYGLGAPASEVDDTLIISLANHCDELVTVPDGLGGSTQQKRYEINIALSTEAPHKTNIEKILSSMNANLVWQGGKFKAFAKKVTTPETYEITESEIVGNISVTRQGTATPNVVRARWPGFIEITNPNYSYQTYVDDIIWPDPSSANPYLEEDGDFESELTIDLPGTTNRYMAEQLAMLALFEARRDTIVELTARESALALEVGDVVNLTYDSAGWTQKPFWVLSMSIGDDNTISLILKEYDDNVYTFDAQDDEPDVPGTGLPDPFTVAAPTSLVLTSGPTESLFLGDGTVVPRIKATWTSNEPYLAHTEVEAKRDTDTNWNELPVVWAYEAQEAYVVPVSAGENWYVRVRAVNTLGYKSDWTTSGAHSAAGNTTAPGSPTGLTVTGPINDSWSISWLGPVADPDVQAYELRYNAGTGGSWATATEIVTIRAFRPDTSPVPHVRVPTRDLPRGYVTIRVKALNGFGVESATDASKTILNWPGVIDDETYREDQKRKRPGADAIAIWGPTYDGSGVTRLYDENGNLDGLAYDDGLGTTVNLRQPVEGASQRNRVIVSEQMSNGDTYTAPTGYTIYSARYVSGGLSVQGASKWDTDPALPNENLSPPTTYAQYPTFDIAGAGLTANLLLRERVTSTLVQRNAAFSDNVLTFGGDQTGTAVPSAGSLPAFDNTYKASVTGDLTSTKSGTFQIRLTLQMRKNSGSYAVKDEKTLEGTLPADGFELNTLLSGYMFGWDGSGGDDAKVVCEEVIAPGVWNLSLTVNNMYWFQSSEGAVKYASMTPNDELCGVEIELGTQ